MPAPDQFLQHFAAVAENTRQQGDLFERLVKHWLTNAPLHKDRYEKVWLWGEWAIQNNVTRKDTGIDLVAETIDGELCAIQCKYYLSTEKLYLGNLSNFTTSVNSTVAGKQFAAGLIVSTTSSWSSTVESKVKDSNIPINRVDFADELSRVTVDWDAVSALLPETDTTHVQIAEQTPIGWQQDDIGEVDLPALLKKILPQKSDKKNLRKPLPHQVQAIEKVVNGLQAKDTTRGKLIMACGTGKTFTALKIAEKLARKNNNSKGNILFLVPSLSLLSQALFDWSEQSLQPLRQFAVCSDSKIGKDSDEISIQDLAIPATTDAKKLGEKLNEKQDRPNVVFSTYHSIATIADAQKLHGAPEFDLIVCDEAHRTTGVEGGAQKKQSYFTKVHDADYLRAAKRLYMTATPRIYAANAKARAQEHEYKVFSMDNPEQYGEELFRYDFSQAVTDERLSDYKVIIVTLREDGNTAAKLREYHEIAVKKQTGGGKKYEIGAEDLVKIIGCWKGLSKQTDDPSIGEDGAPMRRAVAFSSTINRSQVVTQIFQKVIADYQSGKTQTDDDLQCIVEHVDGTQNALVRNKNLGWLKEEPEPNECRILSNVRCLSEGVDVPALDAVMFLNPRKSQVDIVQSVGRVMRKAEGKKYGYIILPVLTPADMSPEEALNDNEAYQVIWQTLNALRSHDSRMDIYINQLGLNKKSSGDRIILMDGDKPDSDADSGAPASGDGAEADMAKAIQQRINLDGWQDAIFARIIKHCGDRQYWDTWAKEVSEISKAVTEQIQSQLNDPAIKTEFAKFVTGLRKNINPSITEEAAVEMLSQHTISKPIFETLFGGNSFVEKNPVSKTMRDMLEKLGEKDLVEKTNRLEAFYESVNRSVQYKIEGVEGAQGRQQIIVDLYDKFFKLGFPKMQENLGIVYTPVEVVDFIVASIDDLLKQEFGRGIGAKNVNFLDPFTGTGTFVTRLLQSKRLATADLPRKYGEEIFANEIVLLAYYIAAVNIEQAYQERLAEDGKENQPYASFDGIALTDTFQIDEKDTDKAVQKSVDGVAPVLAENDARIKRQLGKEITVVFGNPPYSVGQKSANDDNQNLKYKKLDASLAATYVKHTNVTNKNGLYDSYIRAIRWASNRISDEGIVAYVTNGSYLDGNATDGLRKCLKGEFSKIYCFNLRGNQRTAGEISRREGGKIFGSGSRAGIAIMFLIKNSKTNGECQISYYDIGDYHDRDKKLSIIADFGSIKKIPWETITPDKNNDWINQRNAEFEDYLPIGDKENKKKGGVTVPSVFSSFSRGVATGRDFWVLNFSKKEVANNVQRMITFYNSEVDRYEKASASGKNLNLNSFVDNDLAKISWDREIKNDLKKLKKAKFSATKIWEGMYRPFFKQHFYFDRQMNQMIYLQPSFFPTSTTKNFVICVAGSGAGTDFSALMVDCVPNLHFADTGQCFPRYAFAESNSDAAVDGYEPVDNIPPATVKKFREHYNDNSINGDSIFCYVYGVLHNSEYKTKFAADLKKTLPRIPFSKNAKDFRKYAEAGKQLGELHTNYENAKPYPLKVIEEKTLLDNPDYYRVVKMKYPNKNDKTKLLYNANITIENIPADAQRYIVNGKPAVEWIMDRYCVKTDPASGIVNDANQWSDDPKYIINLLCKVVTVSVETMKIVDALPPLFEDAK